MQQCCDFGKTSAQHKKTQKRKFLRELGLGLLLLSDSERCKLTNGETCTILKPIMTDQLSYARQTYYYFESLFE